VIGYHLSSSKQPSRTREGVAICAAVSAVPCRPITNPVPMTPPVYRCRTLNTDGKTFSHTSAIGDLVYHEHLESTPSRFASKNVKGAESRRKFRERLIYSVMFGERSRRDLEIHDELVRAVVAFRGLRSNLSCEICIANHAVSIWIVHLK
jgi:hypothetical protein